ncbi:hypothetical protein [Thermomonas sp. HDW16]|uniref:hypothetical protein n=1 Tax=Thermomonas sp. HDW16 TaxID=2714945 RepID=UPI00140DE388|nr:hypothetical protein [Thermomonas sp. HDW16]QIL19929.1 hypothetical protein G7079_03835 [Thermomonas sp. HDW16]
MIILPPPPSQRRKPDRQQVQEAAAGAGLILPDVAVLALQQGRVIEAIKLIRGANPGLDLTRAKQVMQRMQAQAHSAVAEAGVRSIGGSKPSLQLHSRRPPTVAMGDPPGQLRWLLLVVALLVAAVWIGFGGAI